jgi:hypothetical protein
MRKRRTQTESEHTQIQYLLIKIGRALRYNVYVARATAIVRNGGRCPAHRPELPRWVVRLVMETVG